MMETVTLVASRPTSPVIDVLFSKLTQVVELCAAYHDCAYKQCPVSKKCEKWFNGLCEISCNRKLSPSELEDALIRFSKIQPDLFKGVFICLE
jgi:hypothetical protein